MRFKILEADISMQFQEPSMVTGFFGFKNILIGGTSIRI
jgi:hypothetical protein